MKFVVIVSILLMIFILIPNLISARTEGPHFDNAVRQADLIILAYINNVTSDEEQTINDHLPTKIAYAQVLEVWKGAPVTEVKFLISPVSACDHSNAVVGETAVLMLFKYNNSEIMRITGIGNARFPIIHRDSCPTKTEENRPHEHIEASTGILGVCLANIYVSREQHPDGYMIDIPGEFMEFYQFKEEVLRMIKAENRSAD